MDGTVHDMVCACTAAGAGIEDVGYGRPPGDGPRAGDDGGRRRLHVGGLAWLCGSGGGGGQKNWQKFMFPSLTTTSLHPEIMSGFLAKVAEAEAAIGADNMIGEYRSAARASSLPLFHRNTERESQ